MNKTIIALATAPINCAIHIIRISGEQCFNIVQLISKEKIIKKGYSIQLINIMENDEIIDNVLIMKFLSPKSYTGEDLIEINCHGGIVIAQKIISLLIKNGCRYANKGEFSQRAFYNGKTTISKVESINNLINSKNETTLKIASTGFDNIFENKIKSIANKIFMLIGKIEVNIDYPEFNDVEQINDKELKNELIKIKNILEKIILESNIANKVSIGFNVSIIGKPNVGKSSIINKILNQKKAIVSNVPGTTRDIVEGEINFEGITINFLDTAGLRKTNSKIEKAGIKKSNDAIKKSDLILMVIDASKKEDILDLQLINKLKNKNLIIIKNKSDLKIKNKIKGYDFSVKKSNINELLKKIKSNLIDVDLLNSDSIILQSDRQIALAKRSLEIIKNVLKKISIDTIDLLVEELHDVLITINAINNEFNDIDFLDELFKNFCVGK